MAILDVQQSAILMTLSALQMPRFTQTAMGGKRMAMSPRKMSLPHMLSLHSLIVLVVQGSWLEVQGLVGELRPWNSGALSSRWRMQWLWLSSDDCQEPWARVGPLKL